MVSDRRHSGLQNTPRLRLKPKAAPTGYMDGAWWPRSDDLPTEFADLLTVVSRRLGAITRVKYNLTEWNQAPAELATWGRVVHLDGRRRQLPNTVEILGGNGNKIVLLVVPPLTEPDHAYTIVMAASAPDNASSVDTSLMLSVEDRKSRTRIAAARERWESQVAANQSTSQV